MGVFWRCFYHFIWSTKQRAPMITPQIETRLYQLIEDKSAELKTRILAIGGVADHIHIAVAIPPTVAVSEWVRLIKGYTAHEINEHFTVLDERFQWQAGYGVLTYGEKQLLFVTEYIRNQKAHHINHQTHDLLEQLDDEN